MYSHLENASANKSPMKMEHKQGRQVNINGNLMIHNVKDEELDKEENSKMSKPSVIGPSGKKRLACTNCRRRRKKCDLGFPCDSCSRLKLECNVNEEDLRKKRYTSSYVKNLEGHIAYLETNLKRLVDKVYPNDEQMLNNMMIGDIISGTINTATNQDMVQGLGGSNINTEKMSMINPDNRNTKLPLLGQMQTTLPPLLCPNSNNILGEKKKKPLVKGSFYPEGPVTHRPTSSSVVSVNSLVSSDSSTSLSSMNATRNSQLNKERISDLNTTVIKRSADPKNPNLINNDPMILKSLSNFYRWLYPGHFIFVHRESFLYGFFNHANNNYQDSHYCSTELIYAMCAIGSRLSPDLQSLSESYYEKSKSMVLKLVFDEDNIARITTVQALFCLAFYELGKGNNQQAWYFSGLAIRVGYDMGFQLDPKVWYTDDMKGQLTKSELEIRSRIYWGCYIADHFICMILGRTSSLSVSNSTIQESDELPEVEGTEEFRFIGKHVLQISLPLKNSIILSRIVQIFTSKIFIESDELTDKIEYLNKFNSQVYNWRQSLPEFLKWSEDLIRDEDVSTDPTIAYFWYYYYIVRLTFNKPFIEDSLESKHVVVEIISDIKILFENFNKKFGGYEKSTLFQLYASVLAINCLRKLLDLKTNSTKEQIKTWEEQLKFFSDIFSKKLYPEYLLPKKLQDHEDELDMSLEAQILNQVNTNYTHDFSLSNEIDDLIKDLFDVASNPAIPLS